MDKQENVIKTPDIDYNTLLIGAIVILVTLVLLYVFKKKSVSKNDILLTGICDAGKTYIFTQLLFSEDKETYTSIKENIGVFPTSKHILRFVDIPGQERLRGQFFDQYKVTAKGIVYVIDSVTFQKDIRDVADYLYTILADAATSSLPILILCNKQDESMAKGTKVIKNLLEKEMNLVRQTRSNQLQSVDESSGANVYLGKQGKDFEFSQLSQAIDFGECSALKKEFSNMISWLDRV